MLWLQVGRSMRAQNGFGRIRFVLSSRQLITKALVKRHGVIAYDTKYIILYTTNIMTWAFVHFGSATEYNKIIIWDRITLRQ